MVYVLAKSGESFDSLLRRFKKAVERSGIIADYKKHEVYEKPSVKRKRKREAARKRALKRMKKMQKYEHRLTGNQNFRFNKDKTKKIPITPRKPDQRNKKYYNNRNKRSK